ncbi:pseudouridine synthase [Reichenbachiella versicolor]|uniref:pseudouridine synthase n=1 Tax=Reichenbachiella versicolor TaxID=1821036 RepID=UPI000D6E293C|nr:pseudouridine synthase [Reichenbachiella versicolor]
MKHRHFIIHKPSGYLSQFTHQHRKRRNKKMLGDINDFPEGTMSIGRLDENTEGLLLLTTDGKVSYEVRDNKIEKEYYVQLDGEINNESIALLSDCPKITVKGKTFKPAPCKVERINPPLYLGDGHKIRDERHGDTSWISITISEGKNRQIRKMTAAVGFPTLRLVRIRIGNIFLGKLKSGEVQEVEDLLELCFTTEPSI